MSDETKPCVKCGHSVGANAWCVCGHPSERLVTIPSSEHQHLEAACARYREALEGARDALLGDAKAECESALSSSDAGAALLEDVKGLRRERDEWTEARRLLVATGETTAERAPASQVDDVVQALHVKYGRDLMAARAESADLRARLEAAEKEAAGYKRAWADACQESNEHSAEVRRAVEEAVAKERESFDALLAAEVRRSATEARRVVDEEREAVKRVISGGSFMHSEAPTARFASEVLAAIDRDAEARSRSRGKE